MPENEANEMQETTIPAETRREKFERERMNRRAALKKMGVTTAMSVFAMFSVDDLAHMVAKAMRRQAKDNQIAEVVARELKDAGVAVAKPDGASNLPNNCTYSTPDRCDNCCTGTMVGNWCHGYNNTTACLTCVNGVYNNFCKGCGSVGPADNFNEAQIICSTN